MIRAPEGQRDDMSGAARSRCGVVAAQDFGQIKILEFIVDAAQNEMYL